MQVCFFFSFFFFKNVIGWIEFLADKTDVCGERERKRSSDSFHLSTAKINRILWSRYRSMVLWPFYLYFSSFFPKLCLFFPPNCLSFISWTSNLITEVVRTNMLQLQQTSGGVCPRTFFPAEITFLTSETSIHPHAEKWPAVQGTRLLKGLNFTENGVL